LKDPNELLVAGRGDEIVTAIWQAQAYRPDGVVSFKDIKEAARRPIELGLPWFSDRLTKLTYGRRLGEVYAFGAGTGIGKTDFLTQQITYDVTELDEKVGVFFLEQMPTETAKRLAGKFAGRRFHIPDDGWTEEELDQALDKLDQDRLYFYDSFGATDWEVIRETMRFLAHSEGVRIFYVDHLTALAAAEEKEKEALEKIMAEMASTAKELGIIIHLVSHLSTPDGKPHEEGGRVMIRHFKGSRAIGFWCHFMFGLERDQQHEDERLRSVTTFRVLKDRYTGQATGEVIYLGYERGTGKLYETSIDFGDESGSDFKDETAPF
jgi:twinkle protein